VVRRTNTRTETRRAWSVASVSKPTPAKTRPCGFVKPTPAGFCSRFGGHWFRGNSPSCLGIRHAFVTPAKGVEALYVYCYCLFTIIRPPLLSSSIIYLPVPHAHPSPWQPFKIQAGPKDRAAKKMLDGHGRTMRYLLTCYRLINRKVINQTTDGRVLSGLHAKRPYKAAKRRVGVAPRLRADARITGSRYVCCSAVVAWFNISIEQISIHVH